MEKKTPNFVLSVFAPKIVFLTNNYESEGKCAQVELILNSQKHPKKCVLIQISFLGTKEKCL